MNTRVEPRRHPPRGAAICLNLRVVDGPRARRKTPRYAALCCARAWFESWHRSCRPSAFCNSADSRADMRGSAQAVAA